MARTAAVIVYRSVLFRDVFAKLVSRSGVAVRECRFSEAGALTDLGPEPVINVLLEARNDKDEVDRLVCDYLLRQRDNKLNLYLIDVPGDRIVEYRRTVHHSTSVLKP